MNLLGNHIDTIVNRGNIWECVINTVDYNILNKILILLYRPNSTDISYIIDIIKNEIALHLMFQDEIHHIIAHNLRRLT